MNSTPRASGFHSTLLPMVRKPLRGRGRWVTGLAAGTMAVAVFAAGCSPTPQAAPPPPPREVDVMTIAPAPVRETSDYLGTLATRRSVNVLPQVAGYVRRILVKPGQLVEAGDTLIEVDARQEAAALTSAQAQQHSAQASLDLARQTLARTEALHKDGIASAQELEQAKAAAEAAKAALRSAQAQVEQRQVQLQYFGVRAPFAGTVGDVLVRLGDFVSPSTNLTSIAQADVLEVSVAIPPERARRVTPGTEIQILERNGDVLVSAPVFFIAPQADPRTQLVEVKAAFRNEVNLRPSERVRTRIVYSRREALQVPALSVVRQSGQAFALIVLERDGQTIVERKPIELGALDLQAYVVESGLKEGDRIAVSSIQVLRDGQPIVPVPVPSLAEAQARPSDTPGGVPAPADR